MQEARFPGVVFAISGFLGKRGVWDVNLGSRPPLHLSGAQLRVLVNQGWEVGSHTITHRALPFLNGRELRRELEVSRNYLEDVIGTPVRTVASRVFAHLSAVVSPLSVEIRADVPRITRIARIFYEMIWARTG